MSKAARKKEEERIEKIIRNLLKLPENRRCINCTSLGPQYVCSTFWTFVCTNCSGFHREFTHRVKSISMAKFSAEEVSALQAGGNERAREIYFKVWDPQRHIFPDGSNQTKVRDFIRQVYVDRKYTGESTEKLAVTKTESREEPLGRRSLDSLSYGGRTGDNGSKFPVDKRGSPRYRQDTVKSKSRPARFEIVDDRFRDDDSGRVRRSDAKKADSAESRDKTCLPEVRSVKDILGEDIPPLRVGKFPEDDNGAKNNKNGPQENVVTSTSKEPDDGKPPEITREISVSLIDLLDDPESSDPAAVPQTQETLQSTVIANEGLVKSPRTVNASNASQVNSLELMLFELSAPASGEVPGNADIPNVAPVVVEVHEASNDGVELILPCNSSGSVVTRNDGSQITTDGDLNSLTQQIIPLTGASCDQASNFSPAPNTQCSTSASVIEPFQLGPNVAHNIASQTGPHAYSMEAKSSGRGELPVDLFSGSYPAFQAPVQNWQYCPPHGMGFNMYQPYPPNSMPGPTVPNLARSRNPFDLNDSVTEAQTPMYPSMLPVQEPASNLPAHHSLLSSSHTNSYQLMQSQASPYQTMPPTQIPTYGMSPVPGEFSGQQLLYGVPLSGSQGDNGVGTGRQNDPFASLSPIQQRTHGGYNVPSTANSGGNPFG